MKRLADFRYEGRWVTDMACLKSCLNYLKIDVSDAWLYGASGHAFALNVHEELCPSGPTAWRKERIYELAENVGCKIRTLSCFKSEKDFSDKQKEVWQQVRAVIDEGLPCYGWELDIPEYYIIYGYDNDNYLFSGCSEDNGAKPWNKLGDTGIGVLEVHIVSPGQAADDKQTVREALGFAIEHSKAPEKWTLDHRYQCGLSGYDQWIKALGGRLISTGGMAFNTQVWGECRQKAYVFLKEAKERNCGDSDALLDEAIRCFKIVAEEFGRLQRRFAFKSEQWNVPITDKRCLSEAVDSLGRARDAEVRGLAQFEKFIGELRR